MANDGVYRRGDAITFLAKHKPFVDVSIPPSANDYRDACCVTIAIYDSTSLEHLVDNGEMVRVPNRPGCYYYRYQTHKEMPTGTYTTVITTVTKIDSTDYTNRVIGEFNLLDDGIV